jgi:hypothetical protein
MLWRFLYGLIVASILYALSIGPLYAYYNNHGEVMTPKTARVVHFAYRPLFIAFPETTTWYLSMWHVSDIEAYFILNGYAK